ncbi:MAG: SpoIID/LytB domain-containing protein [Oscillatoriales cyanobacterium RM2_1_1]|nr:SpoIID/LytB domain-containing protein [Oscillatoriales cyanobacterium SM2_3_0]NJO47142.1 SpoIID/LytB domain-containing protein [Oscillatoriales cyanobacterium RM2_1_1]
MVTLFIHRVSLKPWGHIQILPMISLILWMLSRSASGAQGATDFNPMLKIGVVQQFGKDPEDTLVLKAKLGDHLTLRFPTPEGEQVLQTQSVILKLGMQPLASPLVDEHIVLSVHRSYENAEQVAEQWRAQGIDIELAQPDLWQVWAKRSTYNTPLLRRWLVQSIQAQGNKAAHLETRIANQKLTPYWVLGGYRYNRQELNITANQKVIQVSKGPKDKQPMTYGGSLRLQPDSYNTYTLVNTIPLETYLRGVVPHEMGAWPPDASIESQAILSRTYALRNLRRFEADGYQLCANTDCQVYKGLTEVYPSTDRAVEVTRGSVLTHENELVDAVYFSMSGGVTANFEDIWDGLERPYLKSVLDAPQKIWDLSQNSLADETNFRKFMTLKKGFTEEGWIDFRWKESASLPALTQHLRYYLQRTKRAQGNFKTIKTIKSIKVMERSPSGRVLSVQIQTDQGTLEVHKDEIQSALLPPISTLFYIDPIYDKKKVLKGYTFVGGGFGHGVGLSQTGSYQLSEMGWSRDKILNFYFPNTQLRHISEPIRFWKYPDEQVD